MSAVIDKPSTETIRANFNYVVPTGKPAIRYIDWPEMEHNAVPPTYRQHEMAVRNGRPLRDTFKLDVHGFVFADHHTKVKEFTDAAERKRVYDPEVEALIRKHSGATEGVVFGADEINRRGGVLGRKIELLIEDDQSRPDISAALARKLVDQGAVFILSVSLSPA